jgi:hypothetical protein
MVAIYQNKRPASQYRLNSFQLDGLRNLDAGYRIITFEISALQPDDDDYEKKVRLLANLLSSELHLPVEPFRDDGGRRLAIAGSRDQLLELQIPEKKKLNPEYALLKLDSELHTLRFESGKGLATKLAKKAVIWAIERVLDTSSSGLWRYGGRFVSRTPDFEASTEEILVFHAFYFGLLPGEDGSLELAVDPSICYVERHSLFQKYGKNIPARIKGRRYLYRYGYEWYKIDALGVAGPANKEVMEDPSTKQPITIYDRAIQKWGGKDLPFINSLVPDAPTVAYKTVGLENRLALSDLLYGLPGVEGGDEDETIPHEESILPPNIRGQRTEAIITDISSQLWLFGRRMRPNRKLRALPPDNVQIFKAPCLRFAGDQEVKISLENAGQERMEALRGLGPVTDTPFHGHQLIVFPESLPEEVQRDFKRRLSVQINDLYGQTYAPDPLKVDDIKAYTLREQSNAILKKLRTNNGYALLVLPSGWEQKDLSKLHNYLKRRLWETVQTQCASASRILSFYQEIPKNGTTKWVVRQGKEGKYRSYLELLALGYLMVNRKWLWKLAEGTMKHEVHVGIDVYKGIAVFTFIYGDADLITFRVSKSTRDEKLSADLVKEVLIENLGADLTQLSLKPKSIVFHRDGLIFDSEIRGIDQTIDYLQNTRMGVLPSDLRIGIVEIHKNSSTRPRAYRRQSKVFANPDMGTTVQLGQHEAAILTTGEPMLRRGTAHPLYVEVVSGDVNIMDVAHDIYALSHLAFTAPRSCLRLPFTIALADHILRESTPGDGKELWDEENKNESSLALHSTFNNSGRRT